MSICINRAVASSMNGFVSPSLSASAWPPARRLRMTIRFWVSTALALPVVAIAIGLIASGAGLRRAVSVDPALAFGGP